MEERRFLDEEEQDEQISEAPPQKEEPAKQSWSEWLNVAASLAGLTAITLLTFEMAFGSVRFGKIVAYAMGSSLLIGVMLIFVIVFRYALSKFDLGLWRYTFWAIAIPIALLYYLLFVFLIYGQFAPFMVRIMELVMSNAP